MQTTLLVFSILNFVFLLSILGHIVEIKKEISNMKISEIVETYFKQN